MAALLAGAKRGDGDPLDIWVFSERPINRTEVLLNARVVGGISLIDQGAAEDKIISVLENDSIGGMATDLGDIAGRLIERLQYYFETYKMVAGEPSQVVVHAVYGCAHAAKVVAAALEDYADNYGQ